MRCASAPRPRLVCAASWPGRPACSESELTALEHLVRGPLGPAELARLLKVTTAASTGIVDRLASHGHVTRAPHEQDRRRTHVLVTASGREEVLQRLLPMFRALRELDDSFDDAERAAVERYLRGATEAFRQITEPRPQVLTGLG